MNCEWYQRWLTASADNELAGWRNTLLQRHLSMCADCSVKLTQLKRLRELVASQKAHYVAGLDDQNFWDQLRSQLPVRPIQHAQAQPDFEPDGEMVMAYSGHRPAKDALPPARGFSMRHLAWGAVAAGTLAAIVAGVCIFHAPQDGQIALDIPMLPPAGQNRVEFADVTSAKDTWATVVKYDKADMDIAVIWVDGL